MLPGLSGMSIHTKLSEMLGFQRFGDVLMLMFMNGHNFSWIQENMAMIYLTDDRDQYKKLVVSSCVNARMKLALNILHTY